MWPLVASCLPSGVANAWVLEACLELQSQVSWKWSHNRVADTVQAAAKGACMGCFVLAQYVRPPWCMPNAWVQEAFLPLQERCPCLKIAGNHVSHPPLRSKIFKIRSFRQKKGTTSYVQLPKALKQQAGVHSAVVVQTVAQQVLKTGPTEHGLYMTAKTPEAATTDTPLPINASSYSSSAERIMLTSTVIAHDNPTALTTSVS